MAQTRPSYLAYIGTTKIAFIKAIQDRSRRFEAKSLSAVSAAGFERGMVKNLPEAAEALSRISKEVLGDDYGEIISCRVVVSSASLKSHTFQSSLYFHGNPHPITMKDIRQVIAQTRSVATVPLKEVIIQAIPQAFLVNDLDGVQNPLGLEASRIGVTLRLLTLDFLNYSNLLKAFERCEMDVTDVVPSVLAASDSVLDRSEKQRGVIFALVGGNACHFACFKNSVLVETRSIPCGGELITEMLGKNLNMDHSDAERVKEAFGSASPKEEFQEELIPIHDTKEREQTYIKRSEFEKQMAAGLKFFFDRLYKEIGELRKAHAPLNEVVFSGGGARLDGFLEKMKDHGLSNVRLGHSTDIAGPDSIITNPAFSGALGGLSFSSRIREESLPGMERQHWVSRGIESVRNWVFEYF
jgi:cell division protein FtsA